MIEIETLSVTFDAAGRKVRAVEDVSLRVAERESFGLVGESGSGKSTILRAICGLAPITQGRILIEGKPVQPRTKAFARQVQMVFQDPYASLHPRYTIGQAIAEPMRINRLPDPDGRTVELLEDAPTAAPTALGDALAAATGAARGTISTMYSLPLW